MLVNIVHSTITVVAYPNGSLDPPIPRQLIFEPVNIVYTLLGVRSCTYTPFVCRQLNGSHGEYTESDDHDFIHRDRPRRRNILNHGNGRLIYDHIARLPGDVQIPARVLPSPRVDAIPQGVDNTMVVTIFSHDPYARSQRTYYQFFARALYNFLSALLSLIWLISVPVLCLLGFLYSFNNIHSIVAEHSDPLDLNTRRLALFVLLFAFWLSVWAAVYYTFKKPDYLPVECEVDYTKFPVTFTASDQYEFATFAGGGVATRGHSNIVKRMCIAGELNYTHVQLCRIDKEIYDLASSQCVSVNEYTHRTLTAAIFASPYKDRCRYMIDDTITFVIQERQVLEYMHKSRMLIDTSVVRRMDPRRIF